ncbi:Major myo-inositol transporter IolT [Rhodococcus wratislaviensis]|uniref:Major myo-inositol transporter IolT n=1 Tax=Rhodococcus wratislaviensis TaxID=44752 RepID=A0A402C7V8_RHOWR|nr:Major myo-inositol transporter IolT [Rhodococcus wratislaviensis]
MRWIRRLVLIGAGLGIAQQFTPGRGLFRTALDRERGPHPRPVRVRRPRRRHPPARSQRSDRPDTDRDEASHRQLLALLPA